MATRTVEREVATQTVEQYLAHEGWPVAAETVAQPAERKASFFSRMADALWRAYFLTPTGLFIPCDLPFRHSNILSHREKARLEADLMGL